MSYGYLPEQRESVSEEVQDKGVLKKLNMGIGSIIELLGGLGAFLFGMS